MKTKTTSWRRLTVAACLAAAIAITIVGVRAYFLYRPPGETQLWQLSEPVGSADLSCGWRIHIMFARVNGVAS
jgi:hypothetical protein